ncbi:MAG: Uma2 family endonuclease [Gemmataceae bacterium]
MSAATAETPKVWTAEDLLAMPDDGVERWIIRGQLREKPSEYPEAKMTVRNRHHSSVMTRVATAIMNWLRTQPKPRGDAFCGEVGVILPGRTSTLGVDVVYAAPDVVEVQDDEESTLLVGVPTLTVEILSPNDTQVQVREKTREYLQAGVSIVWVVDPHDQIVRVYQNGLPAESYNVTHHMPEHPAMPGFTPAVAEFFE